MPSDTGIAMKGRAAVAGLFLLSQSELVTVCKDESSMALMEIAPNVSVPMMVVTRSFDGLKATVCDRMEPMNDFQVSTTKICWDGRTGEQIGDKVRNVYTRNEKMMREGNSPVEPDFAIRQDYTNYQIKCGLVV